MRAIADEMYSDLRYAFRTFIHNPGFTLVSIAILVLAIGANTLLFTFFNAWVVRPLPMKNPERNVDLVAKEVNGRTHEHWSYPDYSQLRAKNEVFEEMYACSAANLRILEPSPRNMQSVLVSGNFFRIFNAKMTLGRAFGPQEDEVPGRDAVVVLSHHIWRNTFNADPQIAGKTIRIQQTDFTILGVTEPGFNGSEPFTSPDLWVPVVMREQLIAEGSGAQTSTRVPKYRLSDPENAFLRVAGVLKPGMSLPQAQDSMLRSALDLNAQHPPGVAIRNVTLTPRRTYVTLYPEVLAAIVCFFAAFALVLLIACANLAGILLARAAARQREIAIRVAVGASRGRLIRQLLTESVLLCAIAVVPSLLLTMAGSDTIQQYLCTPLARQGYHVPPLNPDWHVFLFSLALALGAGIALGLAPALEATRTDVAARTRTDAGSSPNTRRARLREALLVSQVTASFVLLLIAGIFLRNAQRAYSVDLGFDVDRVIDVRVQGPNHKLIERLRQDPRFEAVSEVYRTPIGAYGLFHLPASVDGRFRALGYNYVDSRYFDTVGLRVRRGRIFTAQEARAQARVAVVSEATARLLWPNQDPIGKAIEVAGEGLGERFDAGRYDVIGVVPDVISALFSGRRDPTAMYLPAADDPRNGGLLLRGRDASHATFAHLKKICAEMDDGNACLPVTLREGATKLLFPFVVASGVSSGLGVLALVMTCIGLFGVVAFTVVRRTREIGIRIALGARPGNVVRSIVARSMRCVALGIAFGIPLCLAFSKVAGSVLYVVETFDLLAYVATPIFLLAVALLAAYVPARRAIKIDPMTALRQE